MTLPVPSEMSAAVGAILTAAQWNSNVRDGINFLANPPICVAYQATLQSLAGGAAAQLSLDAETVDTYGAHSNVTNNSRIIAQVAGYYLAVGQVAYAGNATGERRTAVWVNGSSPAVAYKTALAPNGANPFYTQATALVFLNVGDYLSVAAFQTSGGPINTVAGDSFLAALWVHA